MSGKAKENLHDRVCYTILKAPDRFPADTGMNLEKSFSEMQAYLTAAYGSSSKEYDSIKSLLDGAYVNYRKAEQKAAIRQLQAIENFLAGRTGESASS